MIPVLSLGVEEEYMLVDPVSRNVVAKPSPNFMAECQASLGERVAHEFLQCQVEIGTPVCKNISEVRQQLTELRGTMIDMAEKHGMKLIAASTHPFAQWEAQQHTAAERYDQLNDDMGGTIRRMLICGMHVHAGIEDNDLRIDLMNQVSYFLPHLLALSTSSPFWQGQSMSMKCARLGVFDSMPRTGIPDHYDSWSQYERMVEHMIEAGVLEDASKIWWDLRPSAKYPTLEMRVTDICTRLEDALCITALYQSLLRMLARIKSKNMRWRMYQPILIEENRWRAQRKGCTEDMIDLGKGAVTPFPELMKDILELVEEDADALNCVAEVNHAHKILERGSSACRQVETYDQAIADGDSHDAAMIRVVDRLIEETAADVG